MRIALVEQGTVVNVIEGSADSVDGTSYIESDTAGIGDSFSSGVFTKLAIDPPLSAAQVLSTAQQTRIKTLRNACEAQIYAGFQSSALGALHTYPATDRDQSNLIASVVASTLPGIPADWTTGFWCQDEAGVWGFRAHTPAQIQQAGLDGKTAIESAIVKNAALAAQVMAAATEADVAAIVW